MSDLLQLDGIFKEGYGFIAKQPMRDRRLHAYAKCIYAYMCSYSGKGQDVYPSVSKVCYDLDISGGTFNKYMKQLVELGYVVVSQQRTGGQFSHNIYKIKIDITVPQTTVHGDTEHHDTEHGEVDTNNNNSNKNSYTNNNENILTPQVVTATKFGPETMEYKLTRLLMKLMQQNNPMAKFPTDIDKWTMHIDRLIRLDGYTPEQIAKVIRWCQADSFWSSNILSTKKLREKFPALILKASKSTGNSTTAKNANVYKKMMGVQ